MRNREREREAETQAEGEGAPCREPDMGPDPRTPRSCPGPKAGAKPLSHPGIRCEFSKQFRHVTHCYLFCPPARKRK